MSVSTSRVFKSGNSAAVRLPKDVAFAPETELTLVRTGDVLTMYPSRMSVETMLARLDQLPKPGSIEARDEETIPEPARL